MNGTDGFLDIHDPTSGYSMEIFMLNRLFSINWI